MTIKELKVFLSPGQEIEMCVHTCDNKFNITEEYFEGNTEGIPEDFGKFKVASISVSVGGKLKIDVVRGD